MPGAGNSYFLTGKLAELDANGEWFIDKTSASVYLWPPQGDDPGQHLVEVKRRRSYIAHTPQPVGQGSYSSGIALRGHNNVLKNSSIQFSSGNKKVYNNTPVGRGSSLLPYGDDHSDNTEIRNNIFLGPMRPNLIGAVLSNNSYPAPIPDSVRPERDRSLHRRGRHRNHRQYPFRGYDHFLLQAKWGRNPSRNPYDLLNYQVVSFADHGTEISAAVRDSAA